jgi:hypothetical protein
VVMVEATTFLPLYQCPCPCNISSAPRETRIHRLVFDDHDDTPEHNLKRWIKRNTGLLGKWPAKLQVDSHDSVRTPVQARIHLNLALLWRTATARYTTHRVPRPASCRSADLSFRNSIFGGGDEQFRTSPALCCTSGH